MPSPYQLRVIDSSSLDVVETFELDNAVRPFAVARDESRIFAQLSEFHGVVEIDLADGSESRRLELPIDEGVTEDDFSFEAPHHGLALSADEATLCLAGRASDYVALVDVAAFEQRAIVDVDDAPSWALTTPDGGHCVVANTRGGTVSFISYATAEEVARVTTGLGPKHLEAGAVPADVLAAWSGPDSADGAPGDGGAGVGSAEGAPPDESPGTTGGSLAATGGSAAAVAAALAALAVALRRRDRHRREPDGSV